MMCYLQEIGLILIRYQDQKEMVASGLDLSCGENAVVQNRFAEFPL